MICSRLLVWFIILYPLNVFFISYSLSFVLSDPCISLSSSIDLIDKINPLFSVGSCMHAVYLLLSPLIGDLV